MNHVHVLEYDWEVWKSIEGKTQQILTVHQRCWMDYLFKFNLDITYVKGELNVVVNCLSCYYKSDASKDVHHIYDYIHADAWLTPSKSSRTQLSDWAVAYLDGPDMEDSNPSMGSEEDNNVQLGERH